MTREEAIKVIDDRFEIMGYCESPRLEEALDLAIESLKQSQPRKKGTYTESGENDERYFWYATCNECGSEWMGSRNFCPNCGADMREGEESE